MNNPFSWAKALQISEESLASWRKDVPSDTSLVFWALSSGKIPVGSYLYWAQLEYGLPVLTENFLISKVGQETWGKFKGMNVWTKELMPIAEWDGVLFVAAPEPISNLKWSIPVQFVLADPNVMLKLWDHYTTGSIKHPTQVEPIDVPDEPTVFTKKAPETVPQTAEAPVPSAPHIDMPPPLDTPEGFALSNLPPPPAGVSADSLFDELAKYQGPTNTETSNATSAPEGFSADALNIPSLAEKEAELPKLEDQSLHTRIPENLTATIAIPKTTDTEPRFAAPDVKPTETQQINENKSAFVPNAHIGMQLPYILSNFRDSFAGAFIFSIQSENLNCVAWTESFSPSSADVVQKPISLTGPSAFRVAVRTKNPYFGHVVETQINRQFFNSWGHQTLPPQIVVQPMMNTKNEMALVLLLPNPLLTNGSLILEKAKNFAAAVISEMEKTNSSAAAA